ncbi:hypothetical protein U6B65_04065 [Oscillospiraceae bacterium MB08-C2-2]|nr:hypothetical protein U6B65_04065 [Oscillospiraceae bacterium MB08-C2-2]
MLKIVSSDTVFMWNMRKGKPLPWHNSQDMVPKFAHASQKRSPLLLLIGKEAGNAVVRSEGLNNATKPCT